MSREVQILMWCDKDHVKPTQATITRVITVDDSGPIQLDLCETCDNQIRQLQELMLKGISAQPEQPKKKPVLSNRKAPGNKPRPWKCTLCDSPGSTTRQALIQHIKVHHDLTKNQYVEQTGKEIPLELPSD